MTWPDETVALKVTHLHNHLSLAEVSDAIRSLGHDEETKLIKIAQSYSLAAYYSHEDLVQECLTRVLAGRRPWPRGISALGFLAGVIRSIAWDWRDRGPPKHSLSDIDLRAAGTTITSVPASGAEEILGLFNDDPIAQLVIKGMMEGLKGEEAQRASGLNKTSYESTRRRIRRRIEKYLGGRS